MTIYNQDEAQVFFEANGYPSQDNDGLLAWLRDYYDTSNLTLTDLLLKYIKEVGLEFVEVTPPEGGNDNSIVDANGDFLVASDDSFIIFA